MSGNAGSMHFRFDLGGGEHFSWASQCVGVARTLRGLPAQSVLSQGQWCDFYLTGVKLEVGSVATPFNRQSLAKSMADCERYYPLARV